MYITQSSHIFMRDKSKFDSDAFNEDTQITLNNLVNKQQTLNVANFNTKFDSFVNSVKSQIDRHALLKKLSRRQRQLKSKPWITKCLCTSIKNKRRMFKTCYLSLDTTKQHF